VLLRAELAGRVDRRAGDVRVDVHPARHDDHAACVDARGVRGQLLDDLAAVQADVAHLAVDPVGGIVDTALSDAQHGR
jgi:hypothetical protein